MLHRGQIYSAGEGGGGGGDLVNPPAWTVIGSDGFSVGTRLHGEHFDDYFGGDGIWSSGWWVDSDSKSGGNAVIAALANTDFQFANSSTGSDYTSTADDGLLLEGYVPGGALLDWTAARRPTVNGNAAAIRLDVGSPPSFVIYSAATTGNFQAIAAVIEFADVPNVSASATNYLLRVTEVAGGGGGLDVELYIGAYTPDQTSSDILTGLDLAQTLNIYTTEARAYRDVTKNNSGRGWIRRSQAGTSASLSGIVFGSFL